MIHPTAIIDNSAEIAKNVVIGPYSIIGPKVFIGEGTVLGSHVVVHSHTKIGKNCKIFSFASIGAPPQDLKYKGEETWVEIGDYNIIREYVTINRGTKERGITSIGNHSLIMAYAHIAHDCKIGNHVILANVATLGGHVEVDDHAIVGGIVGVHQFIRIGAYCIIGGASAVVKDIPPYVMAVGNRAKLYGLNVVGLRRHGFKEEVIKALKKAYKVLIRSPITLKEAIKRVKEDKIFFYPEVAYFVKFIEKSERGIPRRWVKE
ncbi:MAG TPA: acyl-ACP--UDP-N-acetylglucosamine O-acyltransferase [Candidatus Desulfofervidus auxilii]|uniref:Acyl-[acyl-carrier-protein]--UDP-N-acetylglucosamine O-acyltransferase n=1 Tax=Desulfofervidus auxilii TaxID=1621989 RepID=A0A7V0IA23_DESA2|nr:acyl-ACP--UDP-N-acetylglucosamine O-acyltransferase [Candidatus Desulfofervidus auxilii]